MGVEKGKRRHYFAGKIDRFYDVTAMRRLAMLSTLELRHNIESGFLPLSCKCELNGDGSLQIQIFDKKTGRVDLLVTGVSASQLKGSREISQLIAELRAELDFFQNCEARMVIAEVVDMSQPPPR
jgi:Protein of unknown function (DUF1652)